MRNRLFDWGKWWFRYESEQLGYGRNSVTGRMCETLKTGVYSQGTGHLVASRADSIIVPDEIHEVDQALEILNKTQLHYIQILYKNSVEKKEIMNYDRDLITVTAESKLIGLLR